MKILNQAALLFCLSASICGAAPKSIYSISPTLDATLILTGTAITASAYAFTWNLTDRKCPCDQNEINSLDRGVVGNNSHTATVISDALVATAVVGPVLYDYMDLGWSQEFFEDSVVFAEVLAVNSALVTLIKFTVQRPGPFAYSGEAIDHPEGYHSFYSGHTSTAVSALAAASMMLHFRYQSGIWPWIGTGAIGTAVALTRVAGGHHFYSDVLVGALVGAGVGILVPWLHRKGTPSERVMLAPSNNGLALLYSKSF